jgi:hypothetical protein
MGTPGVMRLLARPRIRWADNVNVDLNCNRMRWCITFIWHMVGLMGGKITNLKFPQNVDYF